MLRLIPALPRGLGGYAETVGEEVLQRARRLAGRLAGTRILHLNATSYGGGVAELLGSAVPLMQALGLAVEWRVIEGSPAFFDVTKTIHNALQGQEVGWDSSSEATYLAQIRENAQGWVDEYDAVIVHDPQPAALLAAVCEARGGRRPGGVWVWRCHLDLTHPHPGVWRFLLPYVARHDAAVFTMDEFVPIDLNHGFEVSCIPPAIDPLSVKNLDLPRDSARAFLRAFGLDPHRPVMVQISRFDPWKDPTGVIDAYRLVKRERPDVQLLLAGSLASDDPEGERVLHLTREHAHGDPDIFVFTNPDGVGPAEVNAFQTAADVAVQKSLREGFGLTVTEAMWKRRPVIGGAVGGIRLQIEEGETGFLVDSVEQCAERSLLLLEDPARADRMGEAARERVRRLFTVPQLVCRWLELLGDLLDRPGQAPRASARAARKRTTSGGPPRR